MKNSPIFKLKIHLSEHLTHTGAIILCTLVGHLHFDSSLSPEVRCGISTCGVPLVIKVFLISQHLGVSSFQTEDVPPVL